MAIKGINKIINNLKNIKNSANEIDTLFIKLSLEWIRDKANTLLDNNLSYEPNTFGTSIREWDIIINSNYGKLENRYENSASVEFGIGIVGKNNPTIHAQDSSWQYGVGYNLRINDDSLGWTFRDQNGKLWINFTGYEGKSFLYDALMEYKDNKMYEFFYQQAFDRIMRKVIK